MIFLFLFLWNTPVWEVPVEYAFFFFTNYLHISFNFILCFLASVFVLQLLKQNTP